MQEAFGWIGLRAQNATDDTTVRGLIQQMLDQRRDYWLSRIRNATDYRLGYQDESNAVVRLLEKPGKEDWELFTCLNSLRDVEGAVDLILDQNPNGLRIA
jgi:hypothetical protein